MAGTRSEHRKRLLRLSLAFFAAVNDEYKFIGLILLTYAFHQPRTLVRGPYNAARLENALNTILTKSSDKFFKAHLRMDRDSFAHVLSLIQDDPIFISTGRRPQRPVAEQLSVFLMRCAGKTTIFTATDSAVAEGTIYLYCARVRTAFLKIRADHLAWPGPQRREFLKREMEEYGFPGCIGILDGTLIPLADKPKKDGWAYFCRKKYYALAVQAICDHRGIFTHYDMGWPGSVQDTRVFRESTVYRELAEHFNWDEYILCDKGYPLTKFTIRPFADYDLSNDPAEARARRLWNIDLSHLRIAVEHAFGRLKGRFSILRSFPA